MSDQRPTEATSIGSDKSSLMDPELEAELKNVILPLVAIDMDASWHPIGTAFVVSVLSDKQALVITAAHNLYEIVKLDSWKNCFQSHIPAEFRTKPSPHLQLKNTKVYVGVPGKQSFALAQMIQSWSLYESDIAYALFEIKDEQNINFQARLAVDTTPVSENKPVTAVGYTGMKAKFLQPPDYDLQKFMVSYEQRLQARSGVVTKKLPQGISIHKWPGFLVNFGLDSGMSGGPILDLSTSTPLVRGIVGGDMSEDIHDSRRGSGAQAFCPMLWPSLATSLKINVQMSEDAPLIDVDKIIDLVRLGGIDDRGDSLRKFRIASTTTGERLSYDP